MCRGVPFITRDRKGFLSMMRILLGNASFNYQPISFFSEKKIYCFYNKNIVQIFSRITAFSAYCPVEKLIYYYGKLILRTLIN